MTKILFLTSLFIAAIIGFSCSIPLGAQTERQIQQILSGEE